MTEVERIYKCLKYLESKNLSDSFIEFLYGKFSEPVIVDSGVDMGYLNDVSIDKILSDVVFKERVVYLSESLMFDIVNDRFLEANNLEEIAEFFEYCYKNNDYRENFGMHVEEFVNVMRVPELLEELEVAHIL